MISDTGGTLSHAAIVAREYHIPAVLAVGCATVSLKDGDKVFVNGTLGGGTQTLDAAFEKKKHREKEDAYGNLVL